MLRVEFISKSNLYEASNGGGEGLYVFASFCPYDEHRTLYVGEPYYNDRSRHGPTRVLSRKVDQAGRITETITTDDRRPLQDASGNYVYTTYLALTRPSGPERAGQAKKPGYDLRKQPADLCLRINRPGYFVTPSRSRVFVVPKSMIDAVLQKGVSN